MVCPTSLVCIAHSAKACVLTLESWMKTATPGEKLDMTEPPSEAFDRREVVVLLGEAITTLPIGQQASLPGCFNNWLYQMAKCDQA